MDIDLSTILLVVALLACSAFFSAAETAFSSMNLLRMRSMAEEGDKSAQKVVDIASQFDKLLCTILIGNNVVNIALSSLTTVMATHLFGDSGVAIATGVATLLILTFGEITPKSLAKEYSEKIALVTAPLLKLLVFLLTPASAVFLAMRRLLSRGGDTEKAPTITEQELHFMLDTIGEEGVLEEQEKDLVQSALEFDETTVQEILTPRVSLVALEVEDTPEEILETVTGERFSRLPIYKDSIDNVIGLVQSRDILEAIVAGKEWNLQSLMTDVMYIHRTMKISKLLGEFQRKKSQLAVVIDDYGGTMGIVTMEDVLEELVGEIWDEDDEIITEFTRIADNSYRVSGDMNIDEFFEAIEYEPKGFDSSYNTMNGWALERLEHIPEVGEAFTCGLLTVTVEEMDDQRVTQLLITKNELEETDE
ncbi:MAG: hemolysin family protein [Angelakisella sp.]